MAQARLLASQAGQPIVEMARSHTTVSVERAVLRLAGLSGADGDGMPLVNHLVDAVRAQAGLEHGVALPAFDAIDGGRLRRPGHARRRRGGQAGQLPAAVRR